MPAISVSFSAKVASDWDPQKPLTTTKLNKLFDNTTHLREWLGASYMAGAVQDHNHDGQNSAGIPIGANSLRNGSFEDGLSGWTQTAYTGGTIGTNTANDMHGSTALAITSTILANGGGDVFSTEYESCAGDELYALKGSIKASVVNVSSKVEIIWYDDAKAQISASTLFSSLNTTTAKTYIDTSIKSPSTARYKRLKLTGGVPALGTATGTIYFDGMVAAAAGVVPAGTIIDYAGPTAPPGYFAAPVAATNISRTAYAGLYAAIGNQWGAGDGSTTFGSPWFPADYAAIQANGNVGSASAGTVKSHNHGLPTQSGFGGAVIIMSANPDSTVVYDSTFTASVGSASNYAAGHRVLKCVKY